MSKTTAQFPAASTPLNQADLIPVWQSGVQKQTPVSSIYIVNDLTVNQSTNINTNVTLNGTSGVITTQSATTATRTMETGFTVTNSVVTANSVIQVEISDYSGTYFTNGLPIVRVGTVASGSFTLRVGNSDATSALNGTMKIRFAVL